ncbi:MAG: haloacid dehalogenase-like hydrolase [Bauldia sp.]|uniref:HAD family hydrolase n=1 Tax=Bauldia sp. TaxID=2575872 RepID=UPI001D63F0DD|nr:HAD family hydrolase [Bauldia sp.]MCB1495244.1 haloacid dehalogenase-like hydrolase [Bauldia sp.]
MRRLSLASAVATSLFGAVALVSAALAQEDPLPSWNDGATKEAIIKFVETVTDESNPDYVPPAERIATFDNDGTLWVEQPMYVQLAFALDEVRRMAPDHPEWKEKEPFKSVLAGDLEGIAASGKKGLAEIMGATHAGMSNAEFTRTASDWITTAKNPKTGRLNTEDIYQPMLEVIDYLRANEFDVYIVSGGGIEFMRPWTETTYGIPPENVVGSSAKMKYELTDDGPVLMREAEIAFVDDGPGKPVGIQSHIGKRPIAAFGNSDGDYQMLEWTTKGPGRTLGMIVHHDDAEREFAYDRDSHFGKLDKAMDAAPAEHWVLISMKDDWARVFPEQ